MPLPPLGVQLVGSYAKPNWLINRDRILEIGPGAWRVGPDQLLEAQNDAVRLAIYDQEAAGLDIITDGEMRRSAFDRHFYARMGGIDVENQAVRTLPAREIATVAYHREREKERQKAFSLAPRITAPIEWLGPLSANEIGFARSLTRRPVKAAVVGPVTAMDRLINEYYPKEKDAAIAIARALNKEVRALEEAGASIIQIDEPAFHYSLSKLKQYGVEALEEMVAGLTVPVVLHVCYGYAYFVRDKGASPIYKEVLSIASQCRGVDFISIEYEQPKHTPDLLTAIKSKGVVIGLLDLGTTEIESPDYVVRRIREALSILPTERLNLAPDCGMWHLPREVAYRKICSLSEAARTVRSEQGL